MIKNKNVIFDINTKNILLNIEKLKTTELWITSPKTKRQKSEVFEKVDICWFFVFIGNFVNDFLFYKT